VAIVTDWTGLWPKAKPGAVTPVSLDDPVTLPLRDTSKITVSSVAGAGELPDYPPIFSHIPPSPPVTITGEMGTSLALYKLDRLDGLWLKVDGGWRRVSKKHPAVIIGHINAHEVGDLGEWMDKVRLDNNDDSLD
jgi:hypothetical protein